MIDTDATAGSAFASALATRRNAQPIIVPHVVDGVARFDGPLRMREDPSNSKLAVSGCHEAPADLVRRAVAVSRAAQREWVNVPAAQRAQHVRRAIEYVMGQVDAWAVRVALEVGKIEALSRAEALECLEFLRLYCSYAEDPGAFNDQRTGGRDGLAIRSVLRPYGVFGVIAPFNYPLPLAAGPAIAAVLAGNGVVIKAPHLAPWSTHAVYEMFEAMDLPTGLVNIVHGGDEPGEALVASDADGFAFTGSAEVGSLILRQVAAGPYLRPVIAEMGGKNPTIVTGSADLEAAADGIAFSAFDLTGQKCSALSRVLATADAHDRLVELVAERAQGLRMADPAAPDAFAGPLVTGTAVNRYERRVAEARNAGFKLAGGEPIDAPGYFVSPVVVSSVPEGHELARVEHFLPLVTISPVTDFSEALRAANDVPVGLTAGIYTGDRDEARVFLETIEAGCVNVNIPGHATTLWWPGPETFGGWKGSGSTGKQAFSKWYVQQFAREQARKVPQDLEELLAQ